MLSQVHQEGGRDTIGFAEIFFSVAAVIRHSCVRVVTGRGQVGHQTANAKAHHADLARRAFQLFSCAHRRKDIADADVAIVVGIEL
jgi:hypothetical protein